MTNRNKNFDQSAFSDDLGYENLLQQDPVYKPL